MIAAGLSAAPITPQQALQRVSSQKIHKVKGIQSLSKDLLYTYPSSNGDAAVYVFGSNGKEGYLMLSADDSMAPLLGYADNGVFDAENMPPQMKEWLAGYARQQEYARENGIAPYKAPDADGRKAVAPLMKTIWNQNAPFNLYTPQIGRVQTPTGCVATAMAQVMKYWNYPEAGSGTGSITNPNTGRTETMSLSEDFMWDDMLDSYNGTTCTEEQKDAVAFLMKACGYAVDMSYNIGVSGSFSVIAAKALIENFRYNKNLRYYQRDYFEGSRWDEIVYNEVSNGRPVLYGAQSTSGGHEFVCDGYNGEGYYHFNWGWGGMSDGYFLLDSLNPGAIGTGGGAGGGFNYKQDIIVGIQPENEMIYEPTLTQFGELSATAANGRLTFRLSDGGQWLNAGILELQNMSLGICFDSVDGSVDPVYVVSRTQNIGSPDYRRVDNDLNISYSGIMGSMIVGVPGNLPDGKYKITVSTLANNSSQWTPVLTEANAYNYVYVTKSGDNLEVQNMPEATVSLDNVELISKLYYGSVAIFRITATNNSEKVLTNAFYPLLSANNRINLIGDGIVLTLQPHQTVTQEFTTQFRVASGVAAPTSKRQYELTWYNPNEGSNAYYDYPAESVTLDVSNVAPVLEVTKFDISGYDTNYELVPGQEISMDVYQIPAVSEIEVNVDMSCTRGYFGYPLYFVVYDSKNLSSDLTRALFEPMVQLEKDDSAEMTTTLNLSFGEVGQTYAGFLFYQGTTDMIQVQNIPICFKLTGASGIDDIDNDEVINPVYYNLQGLEVKNPNKGDLLIKKQGSKTTKIIY